MLRVKFLDTLIFYNMNILIVFHLFISQSLRHENIAIDKYFNSHKHYTFSSSILLFRPPFIPSLLLQEY